MIFLGPMLVALIVVYPQSDNDLPPRCPATQNDKLSDASSVMGLVRCKSTKSDVEARFGKPRSEAFKSAGMEIYYTFPNGSAATFLIGDDGLLLRTFVYAEPDQNSK
jgi:hypothetical protein